MWDPTSDGVYGRDNDVKTLNSFVFLFLSSDNKEDSGDDHF